jgi:hypothetical protein
VKQSPEHELAEAAVSTMLDERPRRPAGETTVAAETVFGAAAGMARLELRAAAVEVATWAERTTAWVAAAANR